MHDLPAIRENPKRFDKNWARRGLEPQTELILQLDNDRREVQTQLQDVQNERNTKSKKIGEIKREGGDATEIMQEVSALKGRMAELEEKAATLGEALNQHLSALPNMLDDEVPNGTDDTQNKEIRSYGEPRFVGEKRPDHVDIGEILGQMDFETAAKMSGSRFVVLKGGLARLERALAQFMLDTQVYEHGYTEVSPPLLVRDNALYGTSQLPKFAEDQFRTTTDHFLIPTAEVSLTNLVADKILDSDDLPYRFTAHTPCFRSEAGSAGQDTRGMIRLHQFYKVEMVSITKPEESAAEFERMTECAETILKRLDLAYKTLVLCSGDTGFGAQKTYDLEVWLPGQQRFREISSCSIFGDFQARRMKSRFRAKGDKNTTFVHTLNGSGLAVGRTLVAVIENYFDPSTGVLTVPEALKPYMSGITEIAAS
jgi:seryl-tRNA synthetase